MQTPPPARLEFTGGTLLALGPEHARALAVTLAASDAHLRRWTPWVVDGKVAGQSLDERLAHHAEAFAAGAEWVYGIFAPVTREVLGGCGLYPRVGPRAVEIGYWLSSAATGRGLATHAARALTRVAFASPDIDAVEIRCDPGNDASARVPHRLGYRIDGTQAESSLASLQVWCLSRTGWNARIARDVRHTA